MGERRYVVGVLGIMLGCAGWLLGQTANQTPLGVTGLTGVYGDPWINVSSFGAQCDGVSDDTAAIQKAIDAAPIGGSIYVPNTGKLCNIVGFHPSISSIQRDTSGSTVFATFSSSSAISGFAPITVGSSQVFPPIAIFGVSLGSSGSNFNGEFIPICVGGVGNSGSCSATQIQWSQSGTVSETASGGTASLGLWAYQENIKFFGQSIGNVNAFISTSSTPSTPGSGFATSSPIYILTFSPQPLPPQMNGPDVENLWFEDSTGGSYTTGTALGGLYVFQTQGFWIANNFFFSFTVPLATNVTQAGAGITLDGGKGSVQFGTVINNKAYYTRYGITTRNKVSSVSFIQNETFCGPNGGSDHGTSGILDASIGLDIGWMWYQNTGASTTGGENTVIGHQSNYCLIGFGLGSQNGGAVSQTSNSGAGHLFGKSEGYSTASPLCDIGDGSTHDLCSIGVSVLNSVNNLISWQGKAQTTGWHIDLNSGGNVILQPAFSGTPPSATNSTETYIGFCGGTGHTCAAGGSFPNATNVVDAGALGTTAVLGQTLAPNTTNGASTITGDQVLGPFSLVAGNPSTPQPQFIAVSYQNQTTSAIAAGTAVCADTTTGHNDSVVPCPAPGLPASISFVGIAVGSIAANTFGSVAIAGAITGPITDNNCSLGYFIVPGTTSGHVQCKSLTTAVNVGEVLGIALNAPSSGGSVEMTIAPR